MGSYSHSYNRKKNWFQGAARQLYTGFHGSYTELEAALSTVQLGGRHRWYGTLVQQYKVTQTLSSSYADSSS